MAKRCELLSHAWKLIRYPGLVHTVESSIWKVLLELISWPLCMQTGQSKTTKWGYASAHTCTHTCKHDNLAHKALWPALDKRITAVNQQSVILTATHSVVIDTGSFYLECGSWLLQQWWIVQFSSIKHKGLWPVEAKVTVARIIVLPSLGVSIHWTGLLDWPFCH